MNILGDFITRVNNLYPLTIENDELEPLLNTIRNQGDEIEKKGKEIIRLQAKIDKMQKEEDKLKAKLEKAKGEAPVKKTTRRKKAEKTEE